MNKAMRYVAASLLALAALSVAACGNKTTMSETVVVSKEMKAPIEKVFAYMGEPGHAPPSATNIQGTGLGATNDWSFQVAGKVIQGHAICVDYTPSQRKVFDTWGDIDGSETYIFTPTAEGTKVVVVGAYFIQAPSATPEKLKQSAVERIEKFWDNYLQSVRTAVEQTGSADMVSH